jgi:cytochrome b involved in lipid metabolism
MRNTQIHPTRYSYQRDNLFPIPFNERMKKRKRIRLFLSIDFRFVKVFDIMVTQPTFTQSQLVQQGDSKEGPIYVLIDGKVYDVTYFVPSHPGGNVILTHTHGEDATGNYLYSSSNW